MAACVAEERGRAKARGGDGVEERCLWTSDRLDAILFDILGKRQQSGTEQHHAQSETAAPEGGAGLTPIYDAESGIR